ncbi:HPr family phosphocarrier protein [Brevibacillus migulae]|uniref:HPr family phosphocarrier protein n=1 Tax=Brevibacillus migulae TaxID=1644114 RepID=UPI00106DD6B6|nr:HPr family phosphocarrier protein [Brevibacillus migulae]
MVTFTVKVEAEGGLHARPASMLVNKANAFDSKIRISKGEKTAEAKSILNIMTLGVKKGEELKIEVDGADEQEAAEALKQLFASNFAI